VTDALQSPVVENIHPEKYKGAVGDPIFIRATDNFKVVRVFASIVNRHGITIEQGEAVVSQEENEWIYQAKQINTEYTDTRIFAEATDLPGNRGSLSILL
jgi:hypothetical protein